MRLEYILAAALGLSSAAACAHGQSVPAQETQTAASTQNGVRYTCGGVGSDEARAMKEQAARHNLMLTFASRSGNYLSNVDVDIADAHGRTVLKTTCEGPIMLVDVPSGGRYRIHGALAGQTMSAVTELRPGSKGKTVHLVLPGEADRQG